MNKLLEHYQDKLFVDLVLKLTNGVNELIMPVHKIILSINSSYFEKLLINCKEKNQNEITVHVPSIQAIHDIIMGFYGKPVDTSTWRSKLEFIKCSDYLNMPYDASLINDIIVPVEGFDLLLDIIDLIGYTDETIKIINKNLPKSYDILKFPNELINELIIMNTTYKIISGSADKTIKIWDALTGDFINTLGEHANTIFRVCNSLDGQKIVSCGADEMIKIWNPETEKLIISFCTGAPVLDVIISHDNQLIVSGNDENEIKIWDASTGKIINTLKGHTNQVMSVCFSPDNQKIVSGSNDCTIKIWNVSTGKLLNTLRGHTDIITCVCFSPDGQRIVSGGLDNNIKIWNASTGELINTFGKHMQGISSVCFSLDGQRIVSGGGDDQIKIWDASIGKLMNTLSDHTGEILSVCISSDNRLIISVSDDKTIKVWDALSGNLINTLKGHTDVVNSVCCICEQDKELMRRLKKN